MTICDRTVFIGFGEAAQVFAESSAWPEGSAGFDIKLLDAHERAAKLSDFERAGVEAGGSLQEAIASARLVISVVTADQALVAAQQVAAAGLQKDTWYFDMNSVSPAKKKDAAALIDAAGGLYVDAAVMAPVMPGRLDVPILISGKRSDAAGDVLKECGFGNVRRVGDEVGKASSIKMVRSIFVKGLEALTAECLLAAEKAQVTEDVLSSFDDSWPDKFNYNLERMLVHGGRRGAEMVEVCDMLSDLEAGLEMSKGAAKWQDELGSAGIGPVPETLSGKLEAVIAAGKGAKRDTDN